MKYLHQNPQSLFAKLAECLIFIVKPKTQLKKYLSQPTHQPKKAHLPFFIKRDFNVKEVSKNGRKTWTISPKENKSKNVILFVHGGAYVHSLLIFHWIFISKLVKATNTTVVVPDYPLAPLENCQDVFSFIEKDYNTILENHDAKEVILMGDSAGGGFCLSFAQYLAQHNKTQASQLILIAPWLDVSMENPEIQSMLTIDKMLEFEGLQLAGKLYAKPLDTQHYKASPIYGEFENLPKMSIFIGGHDMLLKDCEKLAETLTQKNIEFNYFDYPKMFHDWIMFTPLKESKFAFKQIVNLIKEN